MILVSPEQIVDLFLKDSLKLGATRKSIVFFDQSWLPSSRLILGRAILKRHTVHDFFDNKCHASYRFTNADLVPVIGDERIMLGIELETLAHDNDGRIDRLEIAVRVHLSVATGLCRLPESALRAPAT
jgi:hypothetical protein